MKITSIDQSQSFRGIKLSKSKFEASRDIAQALRYFGVKCSGYKVYFGNYKDLKKQASVCNYIRTRYDFAPNELGVVYFPISNDTYLISHRSYEQKIIEDVKMLDENAVINMLV